MYKVLKSGDRHASARWLAMTYFQPVWGAGVGIGSCALETARFRLPHIDGGGKFC